MLLQQTIENLKTLKLSGMAKALQQQMQTPDIQALTFDERLGLLVDYQLTKKLDNRLQRLVKNANLEEDACIENVDLEGVSGIDRKTLLSLARCDWIRQRQNIMLTGATGIGKSYMACALAHAACRENFKARFFRLSTLAEHLEIAKADGSYSSQLLTISKFDLIVLDDFGPAPLTSQQRRIFLEIVESRYDRSSTIITSQLPKSSWHDAIGDATTADAILDRITHNSHKVSLKGESKRKNKAKGQKLLE